MGFIVLIVVGLLFLGMAIHLASFALKLSLQLLGLVWAVMAGIPIAVAAVFEKILRPVKARLVVGLLPLAIYLGSALSLWTAATTDPDALSAMQSVQGYGCGIVGIALVIMLIFHRRRIAAQKKGEPVALAAECDRQFFKFYFAVVLLGLIASLLSLGDDSLLWMASLAYWFLAVCCALYATMLEGVTASWFLALHSALKVDEKIDGDSFLGRMIDQNILKKEQYEMIYRSVVVRHVTTGSAIELDLAGSTWLIDSAWYGEARAKLDKSLVAQPRYPEVELHQLVRGYFKFSQEHTAEYIDRYLSTARIYPFPEGNYVVHQLHASLVKTCACCGSADSANDDEYASGEWYCSSTCEETEGICEKIGTTPMEKFYADAATAGMVLVAGGQAWNTNHRIVAAGGQGHGIAAEHANHKIDTLLGKKAELLGADNAKHGADRSVNGNLIQTKYYNTARGSVDSAFGGGNDRYLYLDDSGSPMQLEVPKDQYQAALRHMEKKIEKGLVPGVSDPASAKNLVVEGHVTYDQARNIVKFGTIESLTFDAYEGAIIGLGAGSISFGVTACIFYTQTKDVKTAARAAAVQAASTFGKTMVTYVGAQQLHRLAGVQRLLSVVDARTFSPSVSSFLEVGMGVQGRNALSKALRGTIVTSVVIIAVTTGPDLIKLVRGRMSKAQFVKNLAVASSGVAGGLVGSVVGGVAGASFGPVGVFIGRTVGGIAGGMAAAVLANKIAGAVMEEDRVRMIALIQRQIEYLAHSFVLTSDELEALRANLDQSLTPKSIELLFASSNRRAFANLLVKPVVVAVVKQRAVTRLTFDHVIDACEELAA